MAKEKNVCILFFKKNLTYLSNKFKKTSDFMDTGFRKSET